MCWSIFKVSLKEYILILKGVLCFNGEKINRKTREVKTMAIQSPSSSQHASAINAQSTPSSQRVLDMNAFALRRLRKQREEMMEHELRQMLSSSATTKSKASTATKEAFHAANAGTLGNPNFLFSPQQGGFRFAPRGYCQVFWK